MAAADRENLGVGSTVIRSYEAHEALGLAQEVNQLYAAVFGLPPFNATTATIAEQLASFPNLTDRPGFRLTLGQVGTDHVAFGYGFLLPTGTTWWSGLDNPLPAEYTAETGRRTFAVIDYGVLPAWRGHGIGHAVHDELLSGSGGERATLAVRPAATRTQEIYRHWGWQTVGSLDTKPPAPAPRFDILVLDELPVLRR